MVLTLPKALKSPTVRFCSGTEDAFPRLLCARSTPSWSRARTMGPRSSGTWTTKPTFARVRKKRFDLIRFFKFWIFFLIFKIIFFKFNFESWNKVPCRKPDGRQFRRGLSSNGGNRHCLLPRQSETFSGKVPQTGKTIFVHPFELNNYKSSALGYLLVA